MYCCKHNEILDSISPLATREGITKLSKDWASQCLSSLAGCYIFLVLNERTSFAPSCNLLSFDIHPSPVQLATFLLIFLFIFLPFYSRPTNISVLRVSFSLFSLLLLTPYHYLDPRLSFLSVVSHNPFLFLLRA